jgi:hypothetical protein
MITLFSDYMEEFDTYTTFVCGLERLEAMIRVANESP